MTPVQISALYVALLATGVGAGNPSAPARTSAQLALAATLGGGQAGYMPEMRSEVGLHFPRPNNFRQTPITPSERDVVLLYVEKPAADREGVARDLQRAQFLWFDHTGSQNELSARRLVQRWVDQNYEQVRLRRTDRFETRHNIKVTDYDLILAAEQFRHRGADEIKVGRVWVFPSAERTLALLVTRNAIRIDQQEVDSFSEWEHSVAELRLFPREAPDLSRWVEAYQRRGLSEPLYRSTVRSALVKGWDHRDTDNYILVYNTLDKGLVQSVSRELEALRDMCTEIFEPLPGFDQVSTVRICRDMAEFLAYGAPDQAAGYFSPETRELVLFDSAHRDGIESWTNEDTRRVLYHEAVHQYVFTAAGEAEPHTWYHEGLADYFSGTEFRGREPKRIARIEERLACIRAALASGGSGQPIAWRKFLRYDQRIFYHPSQIELCYAQAWSMISFMMEAPSVLERPAWKAIVPTYWTTLRNNFSKALAEHADESLDTADLDSLRQDAEEAARGEALQAAFRGVSLSDIEEAWKAWVLELGE